MNNLREAAQQALAAMEKATRFMSDSDYKRLNETIEVLRVALAAPVQEPVAWLDEEINCAYTPEELDGGTADGLVPLYTAPPRREWRGLTDERIVEFGVECGVITEGFCSEAHLEFARAVEQAHGIVSE